MNGYIERQHTLRTADVDMNAEWRTSAIFLAMQEAGGAHCDTCGLGVEALREHNLAWVLARLHLHMERVPKLGETVTLRTWPKPPHHFFFPRYYELRVGEERVGYAAGLFAELDLTTRRIAKPWIGDNEELTCDLEPPMPLPGNIPLSEAEERTVLRTSRYSDLDINMHVNNTRYIDWFCDCFDVAWHQRWQLRDVLIHYHHEITPETQVELVVQQEGQQSVLKGNCEGQAAFAMCGEWAERK